MAKAEKAKKSGGGLLGNILLFFISLGLILVLQLGFIFFLFALLPSLVASMIDDRPGKHAFKTVLACNLAGMLPTLANFAHTKVSSTNLQIIMSDPMMWFTAYGAAACGWILIWACRFIALALVSLTCDQRIASMTRAKERMVEEWGEGVK